MPTRNVNLTEHLDAFIDVGVNSGRFPSASQVVREGLRLLEQKEAEDQARLDWLRTSTQEAFAAFDRGEGTPLSCTEDLDALVNNILVEVRSARGVTHR